MLKVLEQIFLPFLKLQPSASAVLTGCPLFVSGCLATHSQATKLRHGAYPLEHASKDVCAFSWQVYPPKFKTEEKRAHMTLGEVDAYNRAIMNSSVLVPPGPFHLLDMHHLTQGTFSGPSVLSVKRRF